MPIYVYRCASCEFEHEYLLKMSDAPLTLCPECKKETFIKQVTSAGFQLKGSGWYATDFKGSAKPAKTDKPADNSTPAKTEKKIEESKPASDTKSPSETKVNPQNQK